jgi:hypothetical protein
MSGSSPWPPARPGTPGTRAGQVPGALRGRAEVGIGDRAAPALEGREAAQPRAGQGGGGRSRCVSRRPSATWSGHCETSRCEMVVGDLSVAKMVCPRRPARSLANQALGSAAARGMRPGHRPGGERRKNLLAGRSRAVLTERLRPSLDRVALLTMPNVRVGAPTGAEMLHLAGLAVEGRRRCAVSRFGTQSVHPSHDRACPAEHRGWLLNGRGGRAPRAAGVDNPSTPSGRPGRAGSDGAGRVGGGFGGTPR